MWETGLENYKNFGSNYFAYYMFGIIDILFVYIDLLNKGLFFREIDYYILCCEQLNFTHI